jgi:hypothetical protein
MTHFHERQLIRLVERLDLFKEGVISLSVLVSDADFLLRALEDVDKRFFEDLRKEWAVLEEVWAVAVDSNGGVVDRQGELLVQSAVAALRARSLELNDTEAH